MVTGTLFKGSRVITNNGNRQILEINESKPMDNETIFDVASLTKIIFTTNIMMLLVDKKLVELSDPVFRFLPNWNTNEKRDVTLQHLLSHRSGLDPWRPLYIRCADKKSALKYIVDTPLVAKINGQRIYSDIGFIILGAVIEKIFEDNLQNIFESEIKSKLPLDNTTFGAPKNIENVAATSKGDWFEKAMIHSGTPYQVQEKVSEFKKWRTHVLVGEVNDGNAFHLYDGISAHAGLFSNVSDLLSLCQSYLSSYKENNIFNSTTIRSFLQPSLHPMQGLGFRSWKVLRNSGSISIHGHTGFTGVAFGIAPKEDFAAVMLTNRLHTLSEPIKTEDIWLPFLEQSLASYKEFQ